MEIKSFTLTSLLLLLFVTTTRAVTNIEYYFDTPHYVTEDSYLEINDDDFRNQTYGATQFSITAWIRPSRTLAGSEETTILHLTALEVDYPWQIASYTPALQHLGQLIWITYNGANVEVRFGSFYVASTLITSMDLTADSWHFLYAGVNYDAGTVTFGIYNQQDNPNNDFTSALTLGGTDANEALDDRLTLFLGGSKNYITSVDTDTRSWIGSLYRVAFLVNYYTDTEVNAKALMFGERTHSFYIGMDNSQDEQAIASLDAVNNKIILGDDETVTTNDPDLGGDDGITFVSGDDDKAILSYAYEIAQFNYLSFWVNVYDDSPASASQSILTILTSGGNEIISVVFDSGSTEIGLSQAGGIINSDSIVLGDWNFVYLSFSKMEHIDTYILVNMIVNSNHISQNIQVTGALSEDFKDSINTITFGKILADDSSNFQIKHFSGGKGSYFNFDSAATECQLTLGLENEWCLYCDPATYITGADGECYDEDCPDGYYHDTTIEACMLCDPSCETCNGPGPSSCSSCPEDIPLLFDGYCFIQCPVNTLNGQDNDCVCDTSCASCFYDSANLKAECTSCSLSTQYLVPDLNECVDGADCPIGTIGNSVSGLCDSSCAVGKVYNYVAGECQDLCPDGTVKHTPANTECYIRCPAGFYATSFANAAGETDQECSACNSPCLYCEGDADECTLCEAGYYLHEDTGKCATECDPGFILDADQFFCRACRDECTECSSLLLFDEDTATCLDSCPIGKEADSGVCVDTAGIDVEILNRTEQGSSISYNKKGVLILQGDYFTNDELQSLQWSVDTDSSAFFDGVLRGYKTLVVPPENVQYDTDYVITLSASDSTSEASQTITINVVNDIDEGDFTISPETGVAATTEFTFEINGFDVNNLEYDIVSYFPRTTLVTDTNFTEKIEYYTIARGVEEGSYLFTFPPSNDTKELVIECCGYNDDRELCVTKSLTLEASGDLSLQRVVVWEAGVSSFTTVQELYDYANSLAFFYERGYQSEITAEFLRGALKVNSVLNTQELTLCSKPVECSNLGACNITGSTFVCECDFGQGGFNCFYGEREYDTIEGQVRNLLSRLLSRTITEDNAEQAVYTLKQVTRTMDFITKNTIFFFRDIALKVLALDDLPNHVLANLMEVMGDVIAYVQRPLTKTFFKSTDRLLLLNNLTSQIDEAHSRLYIFTDDDNQFIFDSDYVDIAILEDTPDGFKTYGESELGNDYFKVDYENYVVHVPQEILNQYPRVSVRLMGLKVNPYDDVVTSSFVTSVVDVQLYEAAGQISVEGLSDPIRIELPKIAAYPVIEGDNPSNLYTCYSRSLEDDEWSTEGCEFVNETVSHVVCECTHLTRFIAKVEPDQATSLPSDDAIASENEELLSQILLEEAQKRVYDDSIVEEEDTSTTDSGDLYIDRTFRFSNAGFVMAAIVIVLYFIALIINFVNIRKNSLKEYLNEGKSVLTMTYHPIFSLFIKAHTNVSNTQPMRLTKFFYLLQTFVGLAALLNYVLDLDQPLAGDGARIVGLGFATPFLSLLFVYGFEQFYALLQRKKFKGKRRKQFYQTLHLMGMIFFGGVATVTIGFTQESKEGSYIGCVIFALVLDFFVLDMIALLFVIFKKNDGKVVKFMRKRGFYVDVGNYAKITEEDEAALLDKIRHILKKSKDKEPIKEKADENSEAGEKKEELDDKDKSALNPLSEEQRLKPDGDATHREGEENDIEEVKGDENGNKDGGIHRPNLVIQEVDEEHMRESDLHPSNIKDTQRDQDPSELPSESKYKIDTVESKPDTHQRKDSEQLNMDNFDKLNALTSNLGSQHQSTKKGPKKPGNPKKGRKW